MDRLGNYNYISMFKSGITVKIRLGVFTAPNYISCLSGLTQPSWYSAMIFLIC